MPITEPLHSWGVSGCSFYGLFTAEWEEKSSHFKGVILFYNTHAQHVTEVWCRSVNTDATGHMPVPAGHHFTVAWTVPRMVALMISPVALVCVYMWIQWTPQGGGGRPNKCVRHETHTYRQQTYCDTHGGRNGNRTQNVVR